MWLPSGSTNPVTLSDGGVGRRSGTAPTPLPDRFQKPVVVHPVLVPSITENSNAATGTEGEGEDFPLRIAEGALLRADAPFFPGNPDGTATGGLKAPQPRDTPKMPLILGARFPRLRLVHGVGAFLADLLTDLTYR